MKSFICMALLSIATVLPFQALAQKTYSQKDIAPSKPRVIVTCDAELDDQNSLVRFLLHASDFKIEGLIYASSEHHWTGDGHGTLWAKVNQRSYRKSGYKPVESFRWNKECHFIDDVVDAYCASYDNLKEHDPDYPTPEYIRSKVVWGNVQFASDFSRDTPGSELIKDVLLDDNDEPVYLQAWGGCSTIARALKSIEDIYKDQANWPEIKKKVSSKAILCMSGDQDGTYPEYIAPFWPEIKSANQGSPSVGLAYNAQDSCSPEDSIYYSTQYIQKYYQVGPFAKVYRYWGDGVKMEVEDYFGYKNKTVDELEEMGYEVWTASWSTKTGPYKGLEEAGSFLAEGDTYCYLNLMDNGLEGWIDNNGGWSGFSIPVPDSIKTKSPIEQMRWKRTNSPKSPDFTAAIFNSEAARFQWTTTSEYSNANHYPIISGPRKITASPGETFKLVYQVTDPDKDQSVNIKWWKHGTSSYKGECNVVDVDDVKTSFTVPTDAKPGDSIHLILEATDTAELPLTKYHRLIINVK